MSSLTQLRLKRKRAALIDRCMNIGLCASVIILGSVAAVWAALVVNY